MQHRRKNFLMHFHLGESFLDFRWRYERTNRPRRQKVVQALTLAACLAQRTSALVHNPTGFTKTVRSSREEVLPAARAH